MLGLKGIFKSLQSKRRHGKQYKTMQGHSCDTILGEKGRVSGDVIWGKRTKRKKKVRSGKDSASNVSFQGQQLSKDGGARWAERGAHIHRAASFRVPLPESEQGLKYPQTLTRVQFPLLFLALITLWFKPHYPVSSFLRSV